MKEWKVIFATAVIFGAGVISGGLLVNYTDVAHLKGIHCALWQTTAPHPALPSSTNAPPKTVKSHLPQVLNERFVDRLQTELQLTLRQRADIEKIMADGQDEAHKEFQNIRQEAHEKIRKRLTPKQVKKFDELIHQRRPVKRTQNSTNAAVAPKP